MRKAPPRLMLRVLELTGVYPTYLVRTQSHLLAADTEIAWSVVSKEDNLPYHGDVAWLSPEEIRLYPRSLAFIHSQA